VVDSMLLYIFRHLLESGKVEEDTRAFTLASVNLGRKYIQVLSL